MLPAAIVTSSHGFLFFGPYQGPLLVIVAEIESWSMYLSGCTHA